MAFPVAFHRAAMHLDTLRVNLPRAARTCGDAAAFNGFLLRANL